MKTLVIFAMSLLMSLSAAIGQTTISGKVYSKKDGLPIAGALVAAKGNPAVSAVTDASGHFTMVLPAGIKVLEVNASGFKTKTEGVGQKNVFVFEMMIDPKGSPTVVSKGGSTSTNTGTTGSGPAGKTSTSKSKVSDIKVSGSKTLSK